MIRKLVKIPWLELAVVIVAWILLIGYVVGHLKQREMPDEWKTITHDFYNFSVDYPTKWSAVTSYKEHGLKRDVNLKLRVYEIWDDNFEITIRYLEDENPTINDVAKWGKNRINRLNHDEFRSRYVLRELDFREELVDGNRALVRRYGNVELTFEEVYIARSDSMLIIQLQAKTESFESFLDDFYRIVDSFSTLN